MARKSIPAASVRDRSRDGKSPLLRSAESLGRMIGVLKRQLELSAGGLSMSKSIGSAGRKSNGGSGSVRTIPVTAARRTARKKSV